MSDISVIVVPERADFHDDVLYSEVVWTNASIGRPNLEGRNARYLAPCMQDKNGDWVIHRVYHILNFDSFGLTEKGDAYEFQLGNSFILKEPRRNIMGSTRKFEYFELTKDFGFVEIRGGLLLSL